MPHVDPVPVRVEESGVALAPWLVRWFPGDLGTGDADHGGEEELRSISYMAIPHGPRQALSMLILNGVLDRDRSRVSCSARNDARLFMPFASARAPAASTMKCA